MTERDASVVVWRRSRRLTVGLALLLIFFLPADGGAQSRGTWVGTWATGLQAQLPPAATGETQASSATGSLFGPLPRMSAQTLRQIIRTSIGGSKVRVVFSNVFGTHPLQIGGAHIAIRTRDSTIANDSSVRLTFDGRPAAAIEAGSMLVSDPVDLHVPALTDLTVDMFLPGDSAAPRSPATVHRNASQTNYLSVSGNHSGRSELPVETTLQSWTYLSRVEVLTPVPTPVIVTLGDSITDGYASTPDTNSRWPNVLASRLVGQLGAAAPAVLNVGISGNRVLSSNEGFWPAGGTDSTNPPDPNAGFGPSALARFDRDVLLQPGVSHVIVLESINDIGMGSVESPTAAEIIAGHQGLIQRAHARGLMVYAGTLTPFEGAQYFSEEGEAKRQAVNDWIRTSGEYDAVIDFDAVVRDSNHPARFLSGYQPGDWLHPNDAGYRVMAETVDLTLFRTARDTPSVPVPSQEGGRTAWGAPDLQGVWDFRTITPIERPTDLGARATLTDEEVASFERQALEGRNADRRDGGAAADIERAYNDFWWDYGSNLSAGNRTSLIIDPPNGRIPPMTPEAQHEQDARLENWQRPVRARVVIGSPAHGPEDLGLSERCILGFSSGPPIIPSAYNNNLQVFQTPDHIVIFTEMIHSARVVPLDGRSHLPATIRQWLGNSRGRWEGNTLVVETENFTDKTESFNTLAGAGYGSGERLHLTERFTRIEAETLLYEFTINDPATFIRPFTATIPMTATRGPIYEYACHEGNYGMTNLLSGARAVEREAEQSAR